jgi:ribosomal protein S27E
VSTPPSGTGAAGSCPQCGAPLRFGGGQSLAARCAFCGALVVRAGARLELAGQVPDLVAVDSRLAVGLAGTIAGRPATILGRLQLSQGRATWNEWYAGLEDGFAWIAEAEGAVFVTRPVESDALAPFEALRAGAALELAPAGRLRVEEVGEATLVSFEGELPFRPQVGATYRFADATGADGAFVTLDYGAEAVEAGPGPEAPVLYAGRAVPWGDVKLEGLRPPPLGPAGEAVSCPGCGAPISLRSRESRTVTCSRCRRLLDLGPSTGSGQALRVVAQLEGRVATPIPLGAKGTLRGEPLEVLGWLRRGIRVEGVDYPWDELLLHGPNGYRWLSVYDGHWTFLAPVPAGEVDEDVGVAAQHGDTRFRHFQGGTVRVFDVQGEFYWEVRKGEAVDAHDYVAPPALLSVERDPDGREVSWTRGEYLDGEELWEAFALPGSPPSRSGVGAAQPNPYSGRTRKAWTMTIFALLALGIVAAALALRPRETVVALDVPLVMGEVTLSAPFELAGGPQALEVTGAAPGVSQAWIGLDVALIEEATGESEAVGVELSRFSGRDSEGTWSEGSHHGSAVIGAVKDGRYVLRVEPMLESVQGGTVPPAARVELARGVFLAWPLLIALGLLVAPPLWWSVRSGRFEVRRWAESDHPIITSGDEDDDE